MYIVVISEAYHIRWCLLVMFIIKDYDFHEYGEWNNLSPRPHTIIKIKFKS